MLSQPEKGILCHRRGDLASFQKHMSLSCIPLLHSVFSGFHSRPYNVTTDAFLTVRSTTCCATGFRCLTYWQGTLRGTETELLCLVTSVCIKNLFHATTGASQAV